MPTSRSLQARQIKSPSVVDDFWTSGNKDCFGCVLDSEPSLQLGRIVHTSAEFFS